MTGVHLTIQGTLTTAIHSDIIVTLQMLEIKTFLDLTLIVKANGRVGFLTDKFLYPSLKIPWVNLGAHTIHIDRCIINVQKKQATYYINIH